MKLVIVQGINLPLIITCPLAKAQAARIEPLLVIEYKRIDEVLNRPEDTLQRSEQGREI